MANTIERFTLPCKIELRNATDEEPTGKPVITGYAINWGSRSVDLGGFVRLFRPGCFSSSLKQHEVFALYAHDDNNIVGRQANGSLRLVDDERGLTFELDPPQFDQTFVGRIASGLVDKVSVGISEAVDNWYEDTDGMVVREILSARLHEISFTAYPAFPDTSAEMRMLNSFRRKRNGGLELRQMQTAAELLHL